MGDLTITDLVVEYPSAGEKIRPLDGLMLVFIGAGATI